MGLTITEYVGEYRRAAHQIAESLYRSRGRAPDRPLKEQPLVSLDNALQAAPQKFRPIMACITRSIMCANDQKPIGERIDTVIEKLREIAAQAPTPAIPPRSIPQLHRHL